MNERYKQSKDETPWFPGSVKPVRVGVYRRVGVWLHQFGSENPRADGYAFWDGKKWSMSEGNPGVAAEARKRTCYQPNLSWGRGADFMWCGLNKESK
jgi:hypothetical protein